MLLARSAAVRQQLSDCEPWRVPTPNSDSRIPAIIERHQGELLADWLTELRGSVSRHHPLQDRELEDTARTFLAALRRALETGNYTDLSRPEWNTVTDYLTDLSRQRAEDGFSPVDTAMFVFSLKQPLFAFIRSEFADDMRGLADETWRATVMIDRLGLQTTNAFLKSREDVIRRQQQDLLEISTPVVRLWDGILALPLIGTLDSARTQIVMQNLLEAIVSYSAAIAIIDITGVPTVDTLVAQHLLKTVAAARLMGADCIISGIRPQIAQTIIHLGVDLADVITKATLADAFKIALRKLGYTMANVTNRNQAS